MKKLTTIIALLISITCFSQKRCFLIGYIATDRETGLVYSGGLDTCMSKYPNLKELQAFLGKKNKIDNVRILAISEYNNQDRKEFYRVAIPKPSPVPDSLPPIPDSVQFMSKRHIQQSYKNLSDRLKPLEDKLTVSQYNRLIEGIEAAFGEVIRVATEDYNKKKKPVR